MGPSSGEAQPLEMPPPAVGDGAGAADEAATILSHLNAPDHGDASDTLPAPGLSATGRRGPSTGGGGGTPRVSASGSTLRGVVTSGGAPIGHTLAATGVTADALAVMVARLTAARAVEDEVEELAGDLRSAEVPADTPTGATSPRGDADTAQDAEAAALADVAVTGATAVGGGGSAVGGDSPEEELPALSADEAALLTRLYEEHRLRAAAADVAGHVSVSVQGGTPRSSYLPPASAPPHTQLGGASRTDATAVRESEQRLRQAEVVAFRQAAGSQLERSPSSQELALKARIAAAVARVTSQAGVVASSGKVWAGPGGSEANEATWRSPEHSEPAMASAFTEQRLSAAADVAEAALRAEREAAAQAAAVSAAVAVGQIAGDEGAVADDAAPHVQPQAQQPGTPRRTAAPVVRHMPPVAVPRGHASERDGAPGSPATPHDAILAIAAAVSGAVGEDSQDARKSPLQQQSRKKYFSEPMAVSELATQVLQLARDEGEAYDHHQGSDGNAGAGSNHEMTSAGGGGAPDVGAAAAVVASTLAGFATTVFKKLVAGAKKGAASRRAAEAAAAAAAGHGHAAHRDVAEERAAAELSDRLRVVEAWVTQAEADATYNVAAALREVSDGLRASTDDDDAAAAAAVAALAAEVEAATGQGEQHSAADMDASEAQQEAVIAVPRAEEAPVLSDEDRRRQALAAAVAAAKARILARATPAADAMFGDVEAVAMATAAASAFPTSDAGAQHAGAATAAATAALSAAMLTHTTRAALLAASQDSLVAAAGTSGAADAAAAPVYVADAELNTATGDTPAAAPGAVTRWEWMQTEEGVWERVLVTWTPGEEQRDGHADDEAAAGEAEEQETPVPNGLDDGEEEWDDMAAAPAVRTSRPDPRGGESGEDDIAVTYALRRAAADRAAIQEEKRQRAEAARRAQDAVAAEAEDAAKSAAAALDAAAARDKLVAAVRSEALVRRKALSSAAADRSAHADAMRRRFIAEERRQRDVALNTLATGLCALSCGSCAAALRDMPPSQRGAVLLRMRPAPAAAALRAMSDQHRAEALANAQAAARGADITVATSEGGLVDSQGRAAFNALLQHLTALDAALSGMFRPVVPGGGEDEEGGGEESGGFTAELDTSARVQQWHSALTARTGGAVSPEAGLSPLRVRISAAPQPLSPANGAGGAVCAASEESEDSASGWVEVRPGEWERVC
jgi:hypothetical protein